jgi:hypothetical protein
MPCPFLALENNVEERSRTDFDAPNITSLG